MTHKSTGYSVKVLVINGTSYLFAASGVVNNLFLLPYLKDTSESIKQILSPRLSAVYFLDLKDQPVPLFIQFVANIVTTGTLVKRNANNRFLD